METHQKIALLIFNYRKSLLTDRERNELQQWLDESPKNKELFSRLTDKNYWEDTSTIDKAAYWQKIISSPPPTDKRKPYLTWPKIKVAASIFLVAGIVAYSILSKKFAGNTHKVPTTAALHSSKQTTKPARSKPKSGSPFTAMLITADGWILNLDSSLNDFFARIGPVHIWYNNGQIVCDTSGAPLGWTSIRVDCFRFPFANANTIVTKAKSKLIVKLYEGTELAVKSNSRVQFPVLFAPHIRQLSLSGEAYFNVKPFYDDLDNKIPFIVKTSDVTIKVTGTQFDIRTSQTNSTFKTTLVTGSVEVIKDTIKRRLTPGEQVTLTPEGMLKVSTAASIEDAVAWEKTIEHDNAPLTEILAEIGRIYNARIIYTQSFDDRLSIYISPKKNVADAIEEVKKTGVAHFTITGQTVIVTK